ncbi:MAG: hypothetical protein EBT83_14995, partial [Betaproteobacteria bacterium]|nr:hypothetical protein [Betaproteobacteria bacterium]
VALSTAGITGLTEIQLNAIDTLSSAQRQAVTTAQIASFSPESFGSMGAGISQLTSQQIGAIPTAGIAVLGSRALSNIQSSQVSGLRTDQLAALTTAQIPFLTTTVLNNLSSNQLRAIEAEDIAALTTAQVQGLSTRSLASLTTQQVRSVETVDLKTLSSAQLSALSSAQVVALSVDQLVPIDNTQGLGLNTQAIAALSFEQLMAFPLTTSAQYRAITTTQIAAWPREVMGTNIWLYAQPNLSSSQLGALSTSAIAALTLTPALCALMLHPAAQHKPNRFMKGFFDRFNSAFGAFTHGYVKSTGVLIRRALLVALTFAVLLVAIYGLLKTRPTALVPDEDQGYMFAVVQLPPAASLERTNAAVDLFTNIALKTNGVAGVASLSGFNLLTGLTTSYNATAFIRLKPWHERGPAESAPAILRQLMGAANGAIKDANVLIFNPPPIRGLGTAGGFEFILQDRAGGDA